VEICYGPNNDVAKKLYFSVGFTEVSVNDDGEEAYAQMRIRPKDVDRLVNMPEPAIIEIAQPILLDVIAGCNRKEWNLYSKHMATEDSEDQEHRANVEGQWRDGEFLTSLSNSSEFIGVTRKADSVVAHWKQASTKFDRENRL